MFNTVSVRYHSEVLTSNKTVEVDLKNLKYIFFIKFNTRSILFHNPVFKVSIDKYKSQFLIDQLKFGSINGKSSIKQQKRVITLYRLSRLRS